MFTKCIKKNFFKRVFNAEIQVHGEILKYWLL